MDRKEDRRQPGIEGQQRPWRLIGYPIPGKPVSVVHLEMVREERCLYGMGLMNEPEKAAAMVRPVFERADREMVAVVSLDARLEPVAIEVVAVGGIDSCTIDVRNIFKHAILSNGAAIICFHNHPSGNVSPSREDRYMTRRLEMCGEILGIPLKDHIILGAGGRFYSFQEQGILPGSKKEVDRYAVACD